MQAGVIADMRKGLEESKTLLTEIFKENAIGGDIGYSMVRMFNTTSRNKNDIICAIGAVKVKNGPDFDIFQNKTIKNFITKLLQIYNDVQNFSKNLNQNTPSRKVVRKIAATIIKQKKELFRFCLIANEKKGKAELKKLFYP